MLALGTIRGLSLGWKGHLLVNLRIFFNHIDVNIEEDEGGARWEMAGFYGDPEALERSGAWDLLRRLGR